MSERIFEGKRGRESSETQHKQKRERRRESRKVADFLNYSNGGEIKLRPSRHPPTNWWSERIFRLAFVAAGHTALCAVCAVCVCARCVLLAPTATPTLCSPLIVWTPIFSILFFTPNIIFPTPLQNPPTFFAVILPRESNHRLLFCRRIIIYVSGDKTKTPPKHTPPKPPK